MANWVGAGLASAVIFTSTTYAQSLPDKVWAVAGHPAAAYAVAFSPDGSLLASGSDDCTVRLWRAADGALVRAIGGHTGIIRSVAYSPDGTLLASGSADGTIRLWRVADGLPVRVLPCAGVNVLSVAFSPDGSLLASGGTDSAVRLWRVSDGALLATLAGHGNWVAAVAFSPDGSTVASGSYDNTVRLWRVADGACLGALGGHTGYVVCLAFSPNGSWLASGSVDTTVRLWRMSDGLGAATFRYAGWVSSVDFAPDSGSLLTFDSNLSLGTMRIKLTRVSDGAVLQEFSEEAGIKQLKFSPSGTTFGYGRADGVVVLANTAPGSTPPPPPVQVPTLKASVATDKASYVNKNVAKITVTVTDGANPIAGSAVAVTVVSPKGVSTKLSGQTGASGAVVLSFTVNSKQGTGTYKVQASATKSGCNSGSGSTTFRVTR